MFIEFKLWRNMLNVILEGCGFLQLLIRIRAVKIKNIN